MMLVDDIHYPDMPLIIAREFNIHMAEVHVLFICMPSNRERDERAWWTRDPSHRFLMWLASRFSISRNLNHARSLSSFLSKFRRFESSQILNNVSIPSASLGVTLFSTSSKVSLMRDLLDPCRSRFGHLFVSLHRSIDRMRSRFLTGVPFRATCSWHRVGDI